MTEDYSFEADLAAVRGFLDPREGRRLHDLAARVGVAGPCLEVGSYCGKSTVYLGNGCRRAGSVLFAVDHHEGSEEHQVGEDYHDASLYDADAGRMDSLPEFRRTLDRADLRDVVIPVVASSGLVAKAWATPLALVFIDGGHSRAAAEADYRGWAPHVMSGGVLAIHDLFDDPEAGGQAPIEIYRMALASGLFEPLPRTLTLGVLRRR